MAGVITGFAIIFTVIAVGWLLARRGVIATDAQRLTFNRVAFYATTPALMFSSMSEADPSVVLSPVVGIVFAAALAASGVYCGIFYRQGIARMAMGAAASSYLNAINIGLPVSIYVIGDATWAVPIVFVQVAIITPVLLGALGGNTFRGAVKTGLFSPVVLGALSGFVVSLLGISLPDWIAEPAALLGGASVPMVLMSFGASLETSGLLQDRDSRPATAVASVLKLLGMPLLAWVLSQAFGLGPEETYAAVVLSALPTAQNVYNYAATFRQGETVARDTIFVTTFASLPVLLVIAALFGR